MYWRIITLIELSSVDVILMAGIFIILVLYVTLLIHLKPSLKTKKSTEADLNSETQQQSLEKKPARTSIQPTTPVETKEIVEEPPRTIEPLEKPKAEVQTPKEPVPPPPKEVSKIKEFSSRKAKEIQKKSGPPGCSYHLGYLGELSKNTPIPDECLGCLELMRCMTKSQQNQQNIR